MLIISTLIFFFSSDSDGAAMVLISFYIRANKLNLDNTEIQPVGSLSNGEVEF